MEKFHLFLLCCLAVLFPVAVIATRAQGPDCSDFVKKALELTSQQCTGLERNKVCYGNVLVEAAPRDAVDPASFKFAQPGDVVALADLQTLRMGAFSQANNQWGVAYLRLRANLPDVAAGQFVTAIVFGDAEIRDASKELAKSSGQDFTPMQAFYFRTGLGGTDAACSSFPSDGLLLQTPKGAGKVELVVNEVKLTFGSTILLQAPGLPETLGNLQTPDAPSATPHERPNMVITVFEGEAWVEAMGQRQLVAPGQQVSVPLDQNSRPAGPPSAPIYNSLLAQVALMNMVTTLGEDNLIDPRTPEPTATLVPTATPTTEIVILPLITWTPSATLIRPSATQVPPPSATQAPPPATQAPSSPTNTRTSTSTPTATSTGLPSNTPTDTPTATSTSTATNTPTDTPTSTPTATSTSTATDTPSCAPGIPASITVYAGSPQSATVASSFSLPLQVLVEDSCSMPVPNVPVTFTAPDPGASGTFVDYILSETDNTDSSGIATSTTFSANTIAGSYIVTAALDQILTVDFNLTNIPEVASGMYISAGDGQSAAVNTAFVIPLTVVVIDTYGNPIVGVSVTFTAPASGASGTFASTGTNTETVTSNSNGVAVSSTFTANAVAGIYYVTVSISATSTMFGLTNN